jgi:ribosome recycling factor
MTSQQILKDTREKMDKSLAHLVDQLRQIRTSRASPALVESIRVDYYGTMSPLSQVAQISVPEPRQLALKPVPKSGTSRAHTPSMGLRSAALGAFKPASHTPNTALTGA